MKLGIAARQPGGVAILLRRLVGKRREEGEFGSLLPPARKKMRIEEGKRRVAGNGDFLAGRTQRAPRPRRPSHRRGQAQNAVEIDMIRATKPANPSSRASSSAVSLACTRPRWRSGSTISACFGKAPITFIPAASTPALASSRWRGLPILFSTTPAIFTRASNKAQPLATAPADCACPEASSTSSTGRPSAAATSAEAPVRPVGAGHAVEQAHRAFRQQEIGALRRLPRQRAKQARVHRPGIDVETVAAERGLMEGRIDIVRTRTSVPRL